MRIAADRVEGHISKAPEVRRCTLRKLRETIMEELPGATETMDHCIPPTCSKKT